MKKPGQEWYSIAEVRAGNVTIAAVASDDAPWPKLSGLRSRPCFARRSLLREGGSGCFRAVAWRVGDWEAGCRTNTNASPP